MNNLTAQTKVIAIPIEKLTAEQKIIKGLHEVRGVSFADIAERMFLTEGEVKSEYGKCFVVVPTNTEKGAELQKLVLEAKHQSPGFFKQVKRKRK